MSFFSLFKGKNGNKKDTEGNNPLSSELSEVEKKKENELFLFDEDTEEDLPVQEPAPKTVPAAGQEGDFEGSSASEPFEFILEDERPLDDKEDTNTETNEDEADDHGGALKDISEVRSENVSEKGEKDNASGKGSSSETTALGRFCRSHRVIITVILVIADLINSYGLIMLAREFLPKLTTFFFDLMKLDTIDPAVWQPDTFLFVLSIALSVIVGGFCFFILHKTVALLVGDLMGTLSGIIIKILYPLAAVVFCVVFYISGGLPTDWLCALSAASGGVLYLILSKISLDIPVDSLSK